MQDSNLPRKPYEGDLVPKTLSHVWIRHVDAHVNPPASLVAGEAVKTSGFQNMSLASHPCSIPATKLLIAPGVETSVSLRWLAVSLYSDTRVRYQLLREELCRAMRLLAKLDPLYTGRGMLWAPFKTPRNPVCVFVGNH